LYLYIKLKLCKINRPVAFGAAAQPIAGKPGSHRDRENLEVCAVPVGARLAGDGPQSGPKSLN